MSGEIKEKDMVETTVENAMDLRDSIVTDDNIKEFELLNLVAKKKDIASMVETIRSEQRKFISDGDLADKIDACLENLSVEDVENLTFDEVKEIFNVDGEDKDMNVKVSDDNADLKFKKDYLIFAKKSADTMTRFDEELEKIEAEMEENRKELDRVISEFGNMSNLIRAKLVDKINTAEDDHKKDLYERLLYAFDCAMTFDNVKKFYSAFRKRQVVGDYKNDKTSNYIARRYKRVLEAYGIRFDLTKFGNLEKLYLPEEYHKRPNIFLFSIIKMVSSWNIEDVDRVNGLFLTQFNTNIQNLFYNKFDSEETKANFIKNIIEVIDMFE